MKVIDAENAEKKAATRRINELKKEEKAQVKNQWGSPQRHQEEKSPVKKHKLGYQSSFASERKLGSQSGSGFIRKDAEGNYIFDNN